MVFNFILKKRNWPAWVAALLIGGVAGQAQQAKADDIGVADPYSYFFVWRADHPRREAILRLRDWLRLLSFEVETAQFGCWRPAVRSERWLQRTAWMDALGSRWWPIFGAAYFLVAVKRVQGMRLVTTTWKGVRSRAPAPVTVGHPTRQHRVRSHRGPHG